jgi:hypothetical protein
MNKLVPRFDEDRSIYSDCRWCKGHGCLQCRHEAEKDYQAFLASNPQPIAIFRRQEDAEALQKALGAKAIEKAFAPGGGGLKEIIDSCRKFEDEKQDGVSN